MLVLSRKIGDRICIADNITVVVIEIARDRVRLGIDAPRSVPVDRAEVRKAKVIKTVWCEVLKESTP